MRYTTEQAFGEALPDDVLMHNVGVPLIVQLREFADLKGVGHEVADRMLGVYREHNARVHDQLVKEFPGVESALQRIMASGRRLGVVTSKARVVAMQGLERFSLDRFFDTIVTFDDVPVHKPDPHPLLFAAQNLGVDSSRCAYVGDSQHDMAAAVSAECVSVAAAWGVATTERLLAQGPDYVAKNMDEVARIFEGDSETYRVGS